MPGSECAIVRLMVRMPNHLPLQLVLLLLPGIAASSEKFVVPEYAGAEAGLVSIECVPEESTIGHRFRGVSIDVGDRPNEVILTTAHGFPDSADVVVERCAVAGLKDRRYPILAIWRPDVRTGGAVDDWAVVVTGRLREQLWRQRLRREPVALEGQQIDLTAPIRLPLRFLGTERSCVLKAPDSGGVELETGLFVHTCRSWAGHSGSPILAVDRHGAFVFGIHVGRRWLAETRESLRIGRVIDGGILAAVRDAAAWRR